MADNFYNNPQRTAARQHQKAVDTARQMSEQAQKRAAEAATRAVNTHKLFADQAHRQARVNQESLRARNGEAGSAAGRKQSGPLGKLVGLIIVGGLVLLILHMAGMVRLF